MGCFETITFKCLSCGEEICCQSKSGPCEMKDYEYDKVPIDVAFDANRHAPHECKCGKKYIFDGWEYDEDTKVVGTTVKLKIKEIKEVK